MHSEAQHLSATVDFIAVNEIHILFEKYTWWRK